MAVAFILVIGAMSMITSIIRCGLGIKIVNNHDISPDVLESGLLSTVLLLIENYTAAIACSLPMLKASLKRDPKPTVQVETIWGNLKGDQGRVPTNMTLGEISDNSEARIIS